MPLSTTLAPSSAQAQLGNTDKSPTRGKDVVVQSRETGDVVPNRTQPTGQEAAKAKPFAHFVAGG